MAYFNPTLLLLLSTFLVFLSQYAVAAPQSNQLAMQGAQNAANSNSRPGTPQFSLNAAGAGNNGRNYHVGGNAGVGAKAWESNNGRHSVGVGVNAGQAFGRHQGQSWKSRPDVGYGASYTYRFGGGRNRG